MLKLRRASFWPETRGMLSPPALVRQSLLQRFQPRLDVLKLGLDSRDLLERLGQWWMDAIPKLNREVERMKFPLNPLHAHENLPKLAVAALLPRGPSPGRTPINQFCKQASPRAAATSLTAG
jgi:hypothetical protein